MDRQLRKNVVWNIIGSTFSSFNSLFFLVIVNRVNGIFDGGVFSYAFSLACLFFIIGNYAGRTYQLSDSDGKLNDSEYLLHKIITCIIMMVCCLCYCIFQPYTEKKLIAVITLTAFRGLDALSETLYGFMQKKEQLYIAGISMFVKSLIGVSIFLIVDLLTHNLALSCAILILTNLSVILLIDIPFGRKNMHKAKIRKNHLLSLFPSGFSVFAFSFLAIYIVNVPKYVINGILSDDYQTIFNIIAMPATFMSLCGQYIINPVLVKLVDFHETNKPDKFKKLIAKIVFMLFGILVVVEIGAFLLGIPVLSLIYAVDLHAYKMQLLLILLGAFVYTLATIYSMALTTMQHNNFQLVIYIVSSICGFVLSSVLIRRLGIQGATFAYFGTMLLHGIQYTIYYHFELNSWHKMIAKEQ
ncbi:lipopolysaccharide biosynthesis protein [Sharpea azabuensis]|uniref:lipopolysaccharide biosynthesis protein n=1 Tax=Sharpea azabuensis TaxID=322505 RepID=UPI00156BDA90|nr:hypothetical protein [Sharpea azabuensis]